MGFPSAASIEYGEEGDQFFDSREDLSSVSSSCPISPITPGIGSLDGSSPPAWASSDLLKVWMARPVPEIISVRERRTEFRKWMGLTPVSSPRVDCVAGVAADEMPLSARSSRDRRPSFGVTRSLLLPTSSSSDLGNLSTSVSSSWSTEGGPCSSEDGSLKRGNSSLLEKHLGDAVEAAFGTVAELPRDASLRSYANDFELDTAITTDHSEPHRTSAAATATVPVSSFLRRVMLRREDNRSTSSSTTSSTSSSTEEPPMSRRSRWLKKLGAAACLMQAPGGVDGDDVDGFPGSSHRTGGSAYRVKTHSHKKKSKEFSAVYMVQNLEAHEGAMWTMNFSPNGQYLATGGEDGIVRVWLVEQGKCTGGEYFLQADSGRHSGSLHSNKEYTKKGTKKATDPAIVVVPSKMFQLSEKPLHEFHGHSGDVLDISWSNNKHFVSSSLDKTVRLWQVGHDSCLNVFSHNDYVTCVQFNPVDENYLINGCIDGKIRMWDISGGCVVDWSDTKDVVTSVCFQPDGKGLVAGSMGGNIRFYCISDNQLQLDREISLHGKKKSNCKRITGFQFSSSDHKKLMVTSADSQIRIFDEYKVVNKFKGFHNPGSQICASFTSDGRHVLSASEDSSVYIWNYVGQHAPNKKVKSLKAYEHFYSSEVSLAIPWLGFTPTADSQKVPNVSTTPKALPTGAAATDDQIARGRLDSQMEPHDGAFCLLTRANGSTTTRGFLTDVLTKASATTWPEEKLLPSGQDTAAAAARCRSHQFEFMKSSIQRTAATTSHSWGQVIVTAGLDGRIRSYQNYGLPVQV